MSRDKATRYLLACYDMAVPAPQTFGVFGAFGSSLAASTLNNYAFFIATAHRFPDYLSLALAWIGGCRGSVRVSARQSNAI